MGSLHGIGRASIAFMQFFCCQFGVHCYSFRHASIIHSLNGFDIIRSPPTQRAENTAAYMSKKKERRKQHDRTQKPNTRV